MEDQSDQASLLETTRSPDNSSDASPQRDASTLALPPAVAHPQLPPLEGARPLPGAAEGNEAEARGGASDETRSSESPLLLPATGSEVEELAGE